jgi:heat shock protein HslJ
VKHRPFVVAGVARRARPLLALTTIAAVALAACTSGGGASPSVEPRGTGTPLEGTAWQLTEYVGPEGGTLSVPEAVAASATFTGGTIAGDAGCNRYTGTYTLDGDKMTISGVATTAMACPAIPSAVEKAYLAALDKVATYAVSRTKLELKNAEGKVGLRFAVAEAPALTKTRWLATMINSGTGAVASVIADSIVTALFAADGTVAGSGGCNTYSGTYTTDGQALDFGPLVATEMACANPAVSRQESSYFAALDKVATFAFNGDRLQLRAADGALQVEYRATLE